ncbi:hypothetical protein YB2330_001940 [Saitoella coloradoensis]
MELFTDYDLTVGTGADVVVPVFAPDSEEEEEDTVITMNHSRTGGNTHDITLEAEEYKEHQQPFVEESELSSVEDMSDPEKVVDEVQVDVVGSEEKEGRDVSVNPLPKGTQNPLGSKPAQNGGRKEVKRESSGPGDLSAEPDDISNSDASSEFEEEADENSDLKSEDESDTKVAKSSPRAPKKTGARRSRWYFKTEDSVRNTDVGYVAKEDVKSEDDTEAEVAKPAAKRVKKEGSQDEGGKRATGYTQMEDLRMMILRAKKVPWSEIAKEFPGRGAHNLASHYCVAKLGKKGVSSLTFDISNGYSEEAVQFMQYMKNTRDASWNDIAQYFPGKPASILSKYYSAVNRGKVKGKGGKVGKGGKPEKGGSKVKQE